MALFYSNENFPLPVVRELRRLGHDVLTVQEAAQDNQAIPDEDVLAFAHSLGRAVLTINRKDFLRLHLQSSQHSGIILCTIDSDFRLFQRIKYPGKVPGTFCPSEWVRPNQASKSVKCRGLVDTYFRGMALLVKPNESTTQWTHSTH